MKNVIKMFTGLFSKKPKIDYWEEGQKSYFNSEFVKLFKLVEQELLDSIKDHQELVKQVKHCWDSAGYFVPDGNDNVLDFMRLVEQKKAITKHNAIELAKRKNKAAVAKAAQNNGFLKLVETEKAGMTFTEVPFEEVSEEFRTSIFMSVGDTLLIPNCSK